MNDEGTSTRVQSLMGCCGSKSWNEEWGASGGKESSVDWVNNFLHIFYKLTGGGEGVRKRSSDSYSESGNSSNYHYRRRTCTPSISEHEESQDVELSGFARLE